MTKEEREVMRMALEALNPEWELAEWYVEELREKAITAINEALEQPEQRTWVHLTNEEHTELAIEWGCLSADWVFYAAAVERKVKEKNS